MKNPNATIENVAKKIGIPLEKLVKLSTKEIDELVDLFFAKEKAISRYDTFLIMHQLY